MFSQFALKNTASDKTNWLKMEIFFLWRPLFLLHSMSKDQGRREKLMKNERKYELEPG